MEKCARNKQTNVIGTDFFWACVLICVDAIARNHLKLSIFVLLFYSSSLTTHLMLTNQRVVTSKLLFDIKPILSVGFSSEEVSVSSQVSSSKSTY